MLRRYLLPATEEATPQPRSRTAEHPCQEITDHRPSQSTTGCLVNTHETKRRTAHISSGYAPLRLGDSRKVNKILSRVRSRAHVLQPCEVAPGGKSSRIGLRDIVERNFGIAKLKLGRTGSRHGEPELRFQARPRWRRILYTLQSAGFLW